jgi:hypothetical protein
MFSSCFSRLPVRSGWFRIHVRGLCNAHNSFLLWQTIYDHLSSKSLAVNKQNVVFSKETSAPSVACSGTLYLILSAERQETWLALFTSYTVGSSGWNFEVFVISNISRCFLIFSYVFFYILEWSFE